MIVTLLASLAAIVMVIVITLVTEKDQSTGRCLLILVAVLACVVLASTLLLRN